MSEEICKYCYQFKADHAASHYTSWGWCREHNKFVNDYWGCPDFKTWQTAIEDGTLTPNSALTNESDRSSLLSTTKEIEK